MLTYRVLLLTEEPVLAAGLAASLASAPGIELDVQLGIPSSLTDLIGSRDLDVLLFDFVPEDYPVLLELRNDVPSCKVVLWMRSVPIEVACQAMRLGVRGILRRVLAADLLQKCLQVVAAGEFWFDKELTAGFLESRTVELTPRESRIVPLVAQGLKNKEIASELNVAEATVRIYLSALFRKLGVKDRYELAIYGIKNMLPPHCRPNGSKGDGPASRPTDFDKARLRFLVMDQRAAAPAASPLRKDVLVKRRLGAGRSRQ